MPGTASMMDMIGRLESADIVVHEERCVLVRNRNASCLRCVEACTSGCIAYDDGSLAISPERCIGCGTCASACPTCALEARHPNDAELARQCASAVSASDGLACLACARLLESARGLYDAEKVVSVTCLGRVEESLITGLVASGAQEVVLVGGDCETCAHANGWDMAKRVCRTEERLLEAWRSPARVRLARKLPAAVRRGDGSCGEERRLALGVSGHEAARAAAAASCAARDARASSRTGAVGDDAPGGGMFDRSSASKAPGRCLKVMEDGTLPHFVPDRRERLLNSLASMGQPQDVLLSTRLWGRVSIDAQRCSSCRMCATFCPTGAISKFQDEDGAFGVEHCPGDCVQCRCCVAICPEGALELSEEVRAVDVLSGEVERYEMRPPTARRDQPHAIWHTMRSLMKTSQVYER